VLFRSQELVLNGESPFTVTLGDDPRPVGFSMSCSNCAAIWASVAAYIRERYGTAGLTRVWCGDGDPVWTRERVLGVSPQQLLDDWYRHVLSLGPRAGVGPGVGGTAAMLGWGALALAAGAFIARRKEVT
jgi:hypothetical protein